LRSIKKVNYVNEAYAQIDEMITTGVWEEGQKLPSETVLAKELNVSRVVIREALQRMRAEKKILTRQGVGSFIANPNNFINLLEAEESGATKEEFDQFLQFRSTIERAAVCYATQARTEEDLEILRADLEKMQATEGDPIAYTHADATFHYHIYCATHNPYFIKAYNAVSDMIVRNLHTLNNVADAFRFSRSFHVHLYEYIRDRKQTEAMEEMQNHDAYNETRFAVFSHKENKQLEG